MIPAIRTAQLKDIHSLVDIDLKGYDYPWSVNEWRKFAADPTCVTLIASLRAEPVGVCVWQKRPAIKEGEILKLATKLTYRCRGIGSLLLHEVETGAEENKLLEMVVIVPEIKCCPGQPDDVSQWLLKRGYKAVKPVLTNHFHMYGSHCDGFKFVNSFTGEENA